MATVKPNAAFLSKLVHEPKNKAKVLIKKASDDEIRLLVELILNFNEFGEKECDKTVKRKVTALQKLNWKLKTARKLLIKHIDIIRAVVSIAIVLLINSEICEMF